ncbi:MAG: exodeoxyribonuclease VII large subunit [Thermaerobacter sp.]|nr:exodeoxyribonuclease VII large subunit [Thermaerobacter sp.]
MEILGVFEVARLLTGLMEAEPRLRLVCVRGELANCKAHPSGHFYFSIKDERAQLRGVMFRSRFRQVGFEPKDGDMILVTGQVAFYEPAGQVQVYAEEMEQLGLGAQLLKLQELKSRLEAEGLFRPERKRPLPLVPRRVGIVTSASGAALRDIIQIARRRHPAIDLVIAPARVQGQGAADEIVRQLQRIARAPGVDVVIVGRGGGGQEDLSAFNEESLVRAVAASPVPVVSAVGHETDFTLVDFAADQRAPTPSAAAELCVPNYLELLARVLELRTRLEGGARRDLFERRRHVAALVGRPPLRRPMDIVQARRDRLTQELRLLQHLGRGAGTQRRAALSNLFYRLQALDPQGPLQRGYALVLKEGAPVSKVGALHAGDEVTLRFQDGKAYSRIERVAQGETEDVV